MNNTMDDPIDDPPPPYDFKQAPAQQPSPSYSFPQSGSSAQAQPRPQNLPQTTAATPRSAHPLANPLHTQQPIGVYSAGLRDVAFGLSASAPPLAHVTIHVLRSPSISLHAGGHAESPVLATAQYNFLSSTDITVSPRPGTRIVEQLAKTGWLPDAWGFEMLLPSAGARERFEWKYSRGAEVASLDGKSRGLKCVRVATGEIVCVWAWCFSLKKAGKFRWCVQGPNWGEEQELMVVVTLLAVVERIKRDESSGG